MTQFVISAGTHPGARGNTPEEDAAILRRVLDTFGFRVNDIRVVEPIPERETP